MFRYTSMKLSEFDQIRPFLPPDTEVTIVNATPIQETPKADEVWAVELCSWGNHDGRFNVMCAACGDIIGHDIPASLESTYIRSHYHKPCPKCGKTFIKKGDIRR